MSDNCLPQQKIDKVVMYNSILGNCVLIQGYNVLGIIISNSLADSINLF